MKQLVFRKSVIKGKHLWYEQRIAGVLICLSDQLQQEIADAGLKVPRHVQMRTCDFCGPSGGMSAFHPKRTLALSSAEAFKGRTVDPLRLKYSRELGVHHLMRILPGKASGPNKVAADQGARAPNLDRRPRPTSRRRPHASTANY